jgi:ABC-2 type transport system permease protein
MHSIWALMRAGYLTATSYRLATVLSLVGLVVSVVPLYFIAGALQPVVEASIANEGGDYFGFLVTGIAATTVLVAAVSAVPGVIGGSLGSGTLEALLVTRTPLPVLLVGMSGYPFAQSLLRAAILLLGAQLVGVEFAWRALPLVLLLVLLMSVAYAAMGVVAAALVLIFRTSGPLITAVIAGSGLLGGVYYSTSVIPDWLQHLSAIVPLTYALRAMRMLLLGGAGLGEVIHDLSALTFLAATSLGVSIVAFTAALRHARRSGTLSLN